MSACHHWEKLREVEDPAQVFTPVEIGGVTEADVLPAPDESVRPDDDRPAGEVPA